MDAAPTHVSHEGDEVTDGVRRWSAEAWREIAHQVALGTRTLAERQPADALATVSSDPLPVRIGDYVLIRRIGEGTAGTVFEAFEMGSGEPVAIKLLRHASTLDLHAFKQELRSLLTLADPRVVAPFDLGCDEGCWYLAMELVHGAPLDEALQGASAEATLSAVASVAGALDAMHSAGLVHGDVKPANLMLRDGGVALLDFGLVSHVVTQDEGQMAFGGSPAWMAPELWTGAPPTPAADMFALGVVMFEALEGSHPFGPITPPAAFAHRMLSGAAPRKAERGDIPASAVHLCLRLLSADPSLRPTAREVLQALGDTVEATVRLPWIGRTAELQALTAHRASRPGAAAALVVGAAGIGKTALIEALLASDSAPKFIFRGRCHERDGSPYAGLDSIVEQLAARVRWGEIPDVASLARLFPELDPFVPRGGEEAGTSREGAAVALRAALTQVCAAGSVAVVLDDAHRLGLDAAWLLGRALAGASAPPVWLLATSRDDGQCPLFAPSDLGDRLVPFVLQLQPLTTKECEDLLAHAPLLPAAQRDAVLAAAQGSPFLLLELVLGSSLHTQGPGSPGVHAAAMRSVRSRLERLTTAERSLLEALAIAGGAIKRRAIHVAVEGPIRRSAALLASRGLLRSEAKHVDAPLEISHDLIREAVELGIEAERRPGLHLSLARGLTDTAGPPASIAEHLYQGGDLPRAATWARRAGDEAFDAFAYDRAAELYAKTLDWGDASDAEVRDLRAKSWLNAGRCAQAAREYEAMIAQDQTSEQLRLQASEAWLIAGHVDEGVRTLRPLLGASSGHLLKNGACTTVGLLARLGRLIAKPYLPQATPSSGGQALALADRWWTAGKGLVFVEPLVGLDAMLRSAEFARQAGDVRRSMRCDAFIAAGLLHQIPPLSGRAARTLDEARTSGAASGDRYLTGIAELWTALASMHTGAWHTMLTHAGAASEQLAEAHDAAWERQLADGFRATALCQIGRYQEGAEVSRTSLLRAIDRGDHYGQSLFGQQLALCELPSGEVGRGRAISRWIRDEWSRGRDSIALFYAAILDVYASALEGDWDRAAAERSHGEAVFRRLGGRWMAAPRIEWTVLSGRVLLGGSGRSIEEQARALDAERRPDGPGHAALLRACVSSRAGDAARAGALASAAAEHFQAGGYEAMEAVAQARAADAAGDTAAAPSWRQSLATLGVRDPDLWLNVAAPWGAR